MDKETKSNLIQAVVVTFCICAVGFLTWYGAVKMEDNQYTKQKERTGYCKQLELKDDALWKCIKDY